MNKIILGIIALVLIGGLVFILKPSSSSSVIPTNLVTSTTAKYTLSDVSAHNSAASCWMIIDNKIYDVTSYIDQHPGGQMILQGCGKDATGIYNGVGKHMGRASQMLPNYQVGVLN